MTKKTNPLKDLFTAVLGVSTAKQVEKLVDTLQSEEGQKAVKELAGQVGDTVKKAASEILIDAQLALHKASVEILEKKKRGSRNNEPK